VPTIPCSSWMAARCIWCPNTDPTAISIGPETTVSFFMRERRGRLAGGLYRKITLSGKSDFGAG